MATSPQPEIHRQILRELAFNRECRAPFIVKYYGAYLEESQHEIAILMEFCQGRLSSYMFFFAKAADS